MEEIKGLKLTLWANPGVSDQPAPLIVDYEQTAVVTSHMSFSSQPDHHCSVAEADVDNTIKHSAPGCSRSLIRNGYKKGHWEVGKWNPKGNSGERASLPIEAYKRDGTNQLLGAATLQCFVEIK